MKNRTVRRLTPGVMLGYYDPANPDAPPTRVGPEIRPANLIEAIFVMREYNRLAADEPDVFNRMAIFCLAFFDPLDEDAPLERYDGHFSPRPIPHALAFVKAYNEIACERPRLKKLLGIFPLAEVPAS